MSPEFAVVVFVSKLAKHVEAVDLVEDVGERHVGLLVRVGVVWNVVARRPGPKLRGVFARWDHF